MIAEVPFRLLFCGVYYKVPFGHVFSSVIYTKIILVSLMHTLLVCPFISSFGICAILDYQHALPS